MICFRDKTFCADSDQCIAQDCRIKLTEEVEAAAVRWWGDEGAPIATMSMKDRCMKFEVKK